FVIVYMLYKYLCLCIFGELILLICADNGNNNVNQDVDFSDLDNYKSDDDILLEIHNKMKESIVYTYYLTPEEQTLLLDNHIYPKFDLGPNSLIVYVLNDGTQVIE
ncbi:MAG: hypothetical protein QW303_06135, partial [Nitrososphaerota archaeon]